MMVMEDKIRWKNDGIMDFTTELIQVSLRVVKYKMFREASFNDCNSDTDMHMCTCGIRLSCP